MKKRLGLLVVMILLLPTLPASADRMTVTLMVSHKNMPLMGSKVYVNDVFRGMTDAGGQFSFGVAYFHEKSSPDTLNFKIRIETAWLSHETSIEVIEGDSRAIIIVYVPWKSKKLAHLCT